MTSVCNVPNGCNAGLAALQGKGNAMRTTVAAAPPLAPRCEIGANYKQFVAGGMIGDIPSVGGCNRVVGEWASGWLAWLAGRIGSHSVPGMLEPLFAKVHAGTGRGARHSHAGSQLIGCPARPLLSAVFGPSRLIIAGLKDSHGGGGGES